MSYLIKIEHFIDGGHVSLLLLIIIILNNKKTQMGKFFKNIFRLFMIGLGLSARKNKTTFKNYKTIQILKFINKKFVYEIEL